MIHSVELRQLFYEEILGDFIATELAGQRGLI
jgi:hypothetical protein